MPLQEIVAPWDRQPQEWADIDWQSPLARGLVVAGDYAQPWVERVVGTGVSNTRQVSVGGAGFGIGGTSGLVTYPNGGLINSATGPGQPRTIFFLLETTTTGNTVIAEKGSNENFICQTLNSKFSWRVAGDSTGKCDTTSNITSGLPVAVAGTFNGSQQRVYFEGRHEATSTPGAADFTNTFDFVVGARAGNLFAFPGRIYIALVWNRALSDAEIASISANPWQLFIRREWVPMAASGGGTTVSATPAEASAIGVAASIVAGSSTTINAGPGLASAVGVTASLNTSIVAGIGNASATGVTATIVAGSSTTINAGPGLASATGVTSHLNVSLLAGIGNASASGVTALLKSTTQATPAEASATGVTASIIGTSPVTIAASAGNASAVGVTASLDFGGSLLIGGRRLFPQVQRKRETDEEKKARRIAQGIVEVAKQSKPPAAPAPTVAPVATVAPIRMRASVPVAAEVEALKARAAIQADKEIKRIQALKAVQQEEEDVFYVMSVLARA